MSLFCIQLDNTVSYEVIICRGIGFFFLRHQRSCYLQTGNLLLQMTTLQAENLPGTRNTASELNCMFDRTCSSVLPWCPPPSSWVQPQPCQFVSISLAPSPSSPSSPVPHTCSSPSRSKGGGGVNGPANVTQLWLCPESADWLS